MYLYVIENNKSITVSFLIITIYLLIFYNDTKYTVGVSLLMPFLLYKLYKSDTKIYTIKFACGQPAY